MKPKPRRIGSGFEPLESRLLMAAVLLAMPHYELLAEPPAVYGPIAAPVPSLVGETPFYEGAYAPRFQPLEVQAHFPNKSGGAGHFHSTLLFPLGQTVKGVLKLDNRIVLHDTETSVKHVRVDVRNVKSGIFWAKNISLKIPPGQHDAAFDQLITIDTRRISDGGHTLSFRVIGQDPKTGLDWSTSSEIPVWVQNGRGSTRWYGNGYVKSAGPDSFIAKAWNEQLGYTTVLVDNVPKGPVTKPFTLTVNGLTGGSKSIVGRYVVAIDRSHAIPATSKWPATGARDGLIIYDKPGTSRSKFGVLVDPEALGLERGAWHSVSVTYHDPRTFASGLRQSVVLKAWFFVE